MHSEDSRPLSCGQTRHSLRPFFNEPVLRYCAPFLANHSSGSDGEQYGENEAYGDGKRGPSKHMELSGESRDSPNGETSKQMQSMESHNGGEIPTSQPATVRAVHDPGMLQLDNDNENNNDNNNNNNNRQISCRRQRIKVGFLSAFFFSHTVGRLVEGVVTRLDRRRFETTAIFLQPHPTSATESDGGSGGDDMYNAIRAGTEHVLDVSSNRYLPGRARTKLLCIPVEREYAVILYLVFLGDSGLSVRHRSFLERPVRMLKRFRVQSFCLAKYCSSHSRLCGFCSLQCQVQRFRNA